ncbi:hypothetical protein [Nocardiopsis suaedae]|uniref:ABC transporter permease n=1 Tax=Nocardiopsis suaedae TaxID=3018444 RepID=A0ABT4TS83_9ACTN|nr:hypothetical protein [Nocardiopsis suaedae]MDA2807124.1 hypothetical protein [Nocardiopsis suaedae]
MRARAVAALTRLEFWRMLRNPVLLVAVGYGAWEQWSSQTTAVMMDWGAVVDSMIDNAPYAAAGAFLAAFFPGSRERRYGADSALPLSPRLRLAALLAAAVAVGALALVPTGVLAARPWSEAEIAGVLDPAALAIPPGVGAAAAAGGVAVGMWFPSWALPALLIAVVPVYRLTWALAIELPAVPGRTMVEGVFLVGWEMLMPTGSYSPGLWSMVPGHLGFLALLASVGCGLALIRAERRRSRARLAAVAATALFTTGALGTYTLIERMETRVRDTLLGGEWTAAVGPVPDRVCEELILEYCGYATYESWFPVWQRAAEPVAAALPERVRADLPTVQQSTYAGETTVGHDAQMLENGVAYTPAAWETDAEWARTGLAEAIALAAVGAPERLQREECTLDGQARHPVALWLIVQGADDEKASLEEYLSLSLTRPSARDVATALALLERPDGAVSEALARNWEELVDPATPVERAGALLGVEVAPRHMAEASDMAGRSWFAFEEGGEADAWVMTEAVPESGSELEVELIRPASCT